MAKILWAFLSLPAIAFAADCLGEWNLRHGSSCYMFRKESLSWQEADYFCRRNGGHLVMVNSGDEQTFLDNELQSRQSEFGDALWIDGTDQETEGYWYWEYTGEYIGYTSYEHWRRDPKEPNNQGGNENCMEYGQMYNYYWNDNDCSLPKQFICEK